MTFSKYAPGALAALLLLSAFNNDDDKPRPASSAEFTVTIN